MKQLRQLLPILFVGIVMSVLLSAPQAAKAQTETIGRAMHKLQTTNSLTIGFLGGSITDGTGADNGMNESASWRALVTQWFASRYPTANILSINAGWGGTGSDLGAYRAIHDVGAADLVFVEFAVNDYSPNSPNDAYVQNHMEGIARHIYKYNPNADIVFVTTMFVQYGQSSGFDAIYNAGQTPYTVADDLTVANRYTGNANIPLMNVGYSLWQYVHTNTPAPGIDGTLPCNWSNTMPNDPHPNNRGYWVFGNYITNYLAAHVNDPAQPAVTTLPAPVSANPVENGNLNGAADFFNQNPNDPQTTANAWSAQTDQSYQQGNASGRDVTLSGTNTSIVRPGYFANYLQTSTTNAVFHFRFTGNKVGLYFIDEGDGGPMAIALDSQNYVTPQNRQNSGPLTSYQNQGQYVFESDDYLILNENLAQGTHDLYIKNLGGTQRIMAVMTDTANANNLPPAPTGVTATAGASKITLSWGSVSGAASYNIYRSTSAGGEGATPVANLTTTSATDTGVTPGTRYYYQVTSVNSSGESAKSSEVSAIPTAPSLAAPTGLTATPGASRISLAWGSVTGAATYNIYRGYSAGSEVLIASNQTTSVADTGVTPGTRYFYQVTAVNSGSESARSNEVSAIPTASGSSSVYEAESGTLAGGAAIYADSGASNGHGVYSLQNQGASDAISGVDGGSSGGSYTLTISYANGGPTAGKSLYVNGVKQPGQLLFANNGGWTGAYSGLLASVTLNPGATNVIKIECDAGDGNAVNIDKFTLTPGYTSHVYEAESGALAGGAAVYTDSSASGGYVVGSLQIQGASDTIYGVDGGASGGSHTLTIHFANGGPMAGKSLYVNGVKQSGQLLFPGTGGWTGAYSDLTTSVTLNPGNTNVIKIECDPGDGNCVNIDKFTLF